jgi:hypothetical protein
MEKIAAAKSNAVVRAPVDRAYLPQVSPKGSCLLACTERRVCAGCRATRCFGCSGPSCLGSASPARPPFAPKSTVRPQCAALCRTRRKVLTSLVLRCLLGILCRIYSVRGSAPFDPLFLTTFYQLIHQALSHAAESAAAPHRRCRHCATPRTTPPRARAQTTPRKTPSRCLLCSTRVVSEWLTGVMSLHSGAGYQRAIQHGVDGCQPQRIPLSRRGLLGSARLGSLWRVLKRFAPRRRARAAAGRVLSAPRLPAVRKRCPSPACAPLTAGRRRRAVDRALDPAKNAVTPKGIRRAAVTLMMSWVGLGYKHDAVVLPGETAVVSKLR